MTRVRASPAPHYILAPAARKLACGPHKLPAALRLRRLIRSDIKIPKN